MEMNNAVTCLHLFIASISSFDAYNEQTAFLYLKLKHYVLHLYKNHSSVPTGVGIGCCVG